MQMSRIPDTDWHNHGEIIYFFPVVENDINEWGRGEGELNCSAVKC